MKTGHKCLSTLIALTTTLVLAFALVSSPTVSLASQFPSIQTDYQYSAASSDDGDDPNNPLWQRMLFGGIGLVIGQIIIFGVIRPMKRRKQQKLEQEGKATPLS
ncbi:MAG: hypothetical protein LBC43_04470 [Bifidobacteriaceae bacterium]|nr:hypothetical protein [Bifidobacteriaceae bacterium]